MRLTPEKVFVLIASIFGVLFLVLTPPFQSPDENRHFYRAYQISEGTFIPTKYDQRIGGFLPRKVRDCVIPYGRIKGREDKKTSGKFIRKTLQDPGDDQRIFIDFPASAVYTPVSYLPQALGIAVFRGFGATPILLLYAGRILTLLGWIVLVYLSIRITPVFKWLLVALALLPMSIFIHSSLSADMITNALAFLWIAYVLKCTFSEKEVSRKQYAVLILLIVLLASAKLLYAPLVLLFLIIPMSKLGGKKAFFIRFGLIGLVALLTPVIWSWIQGGGYMNYADYHPDHREYVNLISCANLNEQLSYLSQHVGAGFAMIGNSIVSSFSSYSQGYIGIFGWYEVRLPLFAVVFGYVFLFAVAFADGKESVRLTSTQKIVLFLPFAAIFILIILSQYLIWSCVGTAEAGNLQGRYFIPIVPLLFMLLAGRKTRLERMLPWVVALGSVLLLTISAQVIYQRFYVPIEYTIEAVKVDHELLKVDSFETSNPYYTAGNAASRSTDFARSGTYSSKLDEEQPFGTIIRFENCQHKDVLLVEAWRLGANGVIVVTDESGEKLYLTSEESNSTSGKWEKTELEVTLPATIQDAEISCYLYNPNPADACYFDDMKVILKRRKE